MRADVDDPLLRRRRIVYGRRRGRRRRAGREALLRGALSKISVALPQAGASFDPRAAFEPQPAAVWLEIGFGGGEHLAAQAEANPDIGFIGCEAYLDGVASLVRTVTARQIGNVRIFADDARMLIDSLETACLERIFLLFPDPWPKTRHHKRRFVSRENLKALARILADGGGLRIATDHAGYCRWIMAHLLAHPDFEWTARSAGDWRVRPADWPGTRYENKARRQGRSSTYLTFVRVPR